MAAKRRKEQTVYKAWLLDRPDRIVTLRAPEHVVHAAYGTLSNASRRGATLNAQSKAVAAFVAEYEKQYGPHEGEVITWRALKIEKIQPAAHPRG